MAYLNVRHLLSAFEMSWKDFGTQMQERDPLVARLDDVALSQTLVGRTLDPLAALAAVIRAYVAASGKSVEALASDSGFDPGTLQAMQRGERNPRFRTLRRVWQGLGVDWQNAFSLVQQLDPIQATKR